MYKRQVVVCSTSVFIVYEGTQAIVTQFGKPIGEPRTQSGLHFKIPFIQDVRYVERRILTWDGHPNQIPTGDKKYISIDTTARWEIINPLKFIQTVQNERGAKARLDSILDANTRDVISKHYLVEAVRNSNKILDDIEAAKKENDKAGHEVQEELTGEITTIELGREKLSSIIASRSDKELTAFGIQIIDVQLRRISYEKTVESKVYERMISERQRIAQKIRSIGKGEKAKVKGRLSRDLQRIKSLAYKKEQFIKGKAQAKATAIYAKAMGSDPDFFDFIRSMEAYESTLGDKAEYILSSHNKFLKWLK